MKFYYDTSVITNKALTSAQTWDIKILAALTYHNLLKEK